MSSVKFLIDADAIVSLKNPDDSGYEWALNTLKKIRHVESIVYLSSFAYGEALTVISMQMGLRMALTVDDLIQESEFVMIDVNETFRRQGLKWFAKQTSKNSRFTDCVNMAVMEKYGVSKVFSRDEHYKKNGFVRLGIDV